MTAATAATHAALTIEAAAVTINVVSVGGKNMTAAVYNQLPAVETLADDDLVVGWVNRCRPSCAGHYGRRHYLIARGGEPMLALARTLDTMVAEKAAVTEALDRVEEAAEGRERWAAEADERADEWEAMTQYKAEVAAQRRRAINHRAEAAVIRRSRRWIDNTYYPNGRQADESWTFAYPAWLERWHHTLTTCPQLYVATGTR